MTKKPLSWLFFSHLCAAAFCCAIFIPTSQAQTNPYAPRKVEKESVERVKKDRQGSPVMRDTVPRYGKGRMDFSAAVVFPVHYFAQQELSNPDAGYASQGFAVGIGRFFPFGSTSPFGVQFSLGYVTMGANALMSGIQSAFDGNQDEEETWVLSRDSRPRYQILPFSIGLAYEGEGKKADVYARFMLHAAYASMNEFNIHGEEQGNTLIDVNGAFSSGVGLEIGARLHNVLRVGIAWQYLGRPDMSFSAARGDFPSQALNAFNSPRPISVLCINTGFSLDRSLSRRKGARIR